MIRSTTLRLSTTLMVSASALSLAVPALAQEVLFASNSQSEARVGQRVTQTQGLTQIRLGNGATISVLDRADYRINADGTVDLYGGSITISGGNGETIVRMPEGVMGEVAGEGSAATFSVADDGEGRGHVLTGSARVGRGDNLRRFSAGEMFAFSPDERVRQVVSNGAQTTPGDEAQEVLVADLGEGGPVAAAQNGLPVTLGDALAAAGASSDIVAAARRVDAGVANPSIETFPTGDLSLLIAGAAGLENAYGGTPFTGAQADIIRTYLGFLANGGAGSEFLSAYAGFLGDYLDLIRSGAAPSGFDAVSLGEINSFITYRGRTSGFSTLAEADRVLAEAYLAFLLGGGNPDLFAGTFTDLTTAYFAFVRGGGDPAAFGGATQATLDEYIAFLADTGLVQQLSDQNRTLVELYLANGGLAFVGQYEAVLAAYSDYLASGGLPSAYGAIDQVTLRKYLEMLVNTGLLDTVAAGQAGFYADYLAFLRAGGDVDAFAGLPVNIFTGYATDLDAYFAFLASGNLPSEYTGGDIAELQSFVSQLAAVGALDAFLGDQAAFFAAFNSFVTGGGDVDAFEQLNANIFAGYAVSLDAYFAFLNGGGLPSAYTDEQIEVLNSYLAQLAAAGALERFLGAEADFFADYLAFLQSGGQIDTFAQLNANIFAGYASALADYYAYLENGGIPSAYGALTQETISDYLAALAAVGATDSFLADLAAFYTDYFAFIAGGGNPDNFAGLPVPPDFPAFASALNAFVLFLDNGGLPSGYTDEDLATLQTYLEAIVSSGQLADLLGSNADLLTAYFAFLSSGGAADGFTGLPIYGDYVSALNAYYAFLAGGGLPQDYTVTDPAVLELYLAALNGAGGLAAFTDLDAFFAQYYAFVSGGGDPAQFAGLPVYADYVSALNAYYAFLASGGLPSDYTVLTQAQIDAYLAALSGVQGGLGAFGGLNGFFETFYAFLLGGGVADQFAGLPVNGGNLGGLTPINSGNLRSVVQTDDFARVGITTASVDSEGRIQMITGDQSRDNLDSSGLTAQEFGRYGDSIAWTRYTSGTQSFHAFVAVPMVNRPTSGTVDYGLIGGTAPTDEQLNPGQTGTFSGAMQLIFNSFAARMRLSGRVVLGGRNLTFATSTHVDLAADGTLQNPGLRILNNGSLAGASGRVVGGLFGENGEYGAFSYRLDGPVYDDYLITGVAVFGATGDFLDSIGSGTVVGPRNPDGSEPDAGGGSGGGTGSGTFAYTGGFVADAARFFVRGADANGTVGLGATATSFTIDDQGRLSQLDGQGGCLICQSTSFDLSGIEVVETYGDERFLIGRAADGEFDYTASNGTVTTYFPGVNNGFDYLLAAPVGNGFTLPTSGVILYDLAAATQPFFTSGVSVPGTYDAQIGIAYGSQVAIGIEGVITMPDFSSLGDLVLNFTTPGGLQNVDGYVTGFTDSIDPNRYLMNVEMSANQDVCVAAGCFYNMGVYVGGDDTNAIGVNYFGNGFRDAGLLSGKAIFTANGSIDTGGGGGGGSNSGTGFTGTRENIAYYTYLDGSLNQAFGGTATLANGELTRLESIIGSVDVNTASIVEAGDNGTLAWARWADGDVQSNGLFGATTLSIGADGGYHVFAGETTRTLPASGTVTYSQIGGTAATDNQGSAPGTLTGNLAIAFGTVSRVGYDFAMEVGGKSWAVSTNGGAADPGSSDINLVVGSGIWTFGGTYTSTVGTVTAGGDACAVNCIVNISGVMFGENAQFAGVAMNVTDVGSVATGASGLAIFGPNSGTNPYVQAPSHLPSVDPIASANRWERWNVPVTGNIQGVPPVDMDIAPGITPERTGPQRALDASDAERMLCGMITFPAEAR